MTPDVASDRSAASLAKAAAGSAPAWRVTRLLMIEEWIFVAAVVAAGGIYLFSLLPRPQIPQSLRAAMAGFKALCGIGFGFADFIRTGTAEGWDRFRALNQEIRKVSGPDAAEEKAFSIGPHEGDDWGP